MHGLFVYVPVAYPKLPVSAFGQPFQRSQRPNLADSRHSRRFKLQAQFVTYLQPSLAGAATDNSIWRFRRSCSWAIQSVNGRSFTPPKPGSGCRGVAVGAT
jgi:hypothetical protein